MSSSGLSGRSLPDGVASAQANPLGDGTVLTLSFGKLLLGAEGLVALLDLGLVCVENCAPDFHCRLNEWIGLTGLAGCTNRHLEGWSRRRAGLMGEVVDLRVCVICVGGQGLASLGGSGDVILRQKFSMC